MPYSLLHDSRTGRRTSWSANFADREVRVPFLMLDHHQSCGVGSITILVVTWALRQCGHIDRLGSRVNVKRFLNLFSCAHAIQKRKRRSELLACRTPEKLAKPATASPESLFESRISNLEFRIERRRQRSNVNIIEPQRTAQITGELLTRIPPQRQIGSHRTL